MGKATGFLDYERVEGPVCAPEKRVQHFREFHKSLTLKEQQEQGARCMACGVPFCQTGVPMNGGTLGCPLHNLIPETNELVYRGNMDQAYRRLSRTHGLPEFTCRVCPALCEQACTCGYQGEAVSVRENEKAIIEYAFRTGAVEEKEPAVRTGKSVAIIGSGPAGLAAAQLLNRRGHLVTIYEKDAKAGGLLRYGIPNMKLDKRIIDRRIDQMKRAGVRFECGVNVGVDITGEELLAKYDRVILCTGAARPRDMQMPGREAKGVALAIDFLRHVNEKLMDSDYEVEALMENRNFAYRSMKGKHVVIIGGGDTATDCVATALRLGAASTKQIIRRPAPAAVRSESCHWPEPVNLLQVDYGQEEAIALMGQDPRMFQHAVTECIMDKRGKLKAVMVAQTCPKKDPVTGRVTWVPVEGTEEKIKADYLFIAAGFAGADKDVCDTLGVELDGRSNAKTAASDDYQTNSDRVFTAGDVHRGQSLVVWAMAEGRAAAKAVDVSLMGYTNL